MIRETELGILSSRFLLYITNLQDYLFDLVRISDPSFGRGHPKVIIYLSLTAESSTPKIGGREIAFRVLIPKTSPPSSRLRGHLSLRVYRLQGVEPGSQFFG